MVDFQTGSWSSFRLPKRPQLCPHCLSPTSLCVPLCEPIFLVEGFSFAELAYHHIYTVFICWWRSSLSIPVRFIPGSSAVPESLGSQASCLSGAVFACKLPNPPVFFKSSLDYSWYLIYCKRHVHSCTVLFPSTSPVCVCTYLLLRWHWLVTLGSLRGAQCNCMSVHTAACSPRVTTPSIPSFCLLPTPLPSGTHLSVFCIQDTVLILFCWFICFLFVLHSTHKWEKSQFLSFSTWLISLITTPLRPIHGVASGDVSSFRWVVCRCTHLPPDPRAARTRVLAAVRNAARGRGVLCSGRLLEEDRWRWIQCWIFRQKGGQRADAKGMRLVWTEECRWRGRRRWVGHVLVGAPRRRLGFRWSKACFCNQQENRDPQQAFRLWLKKKHEEQLRERKTEELRKQEEFLFFLKGAAGRDRAFKQ